MEFAKLFSSAFIEVATGDDVRVAAIGFGTEVEEYFGYDSFSSKETISEAIMSNITFKDYSQQTNTPGGEIFLSL